MKVIYFTLFLLMNVIRSFASHDLDHLVEKGSLASFRLDHRARLGNAPKPDHLVDPKATLNVIYLVKERAVAYERSLDEEDQVLTRSPVNRAGRSESAIVTNFGSSHSNLPPRFKKISVDHSPLSRSVVQVAPHPLPIKLDGLVTPCKCPDSPKLHESQKVHVSHKDSHESDVEDHDALVKRCSAMDVVMDHAHNSELKHVQLTESPALESRGSAVSSLDLKPIRLSGSVRYKESRASSEVIQFNGSDEYKMNEDDLEDEQLRKRESSGCYKRDAVIIVGRPMYHCARRSLEYGGATSVYIQDNRRTHKMAKFMRSVSDVAERDDNDYAIDIRGVAMNMLGKVLGRVCLFSGSNGLNDGDVLKLEFILLFANVNEQYLLNPDYKSAEFCKLLMSRKYLLVFLLNNEHMLRTGKISDGTAGMIFRHHMVRSHVLTLVNALKSSAYVNEAVLSPVSPGKLDNAIGAPQIIQNEIMTQNEFTILSKAFLDLYKLGEAGCNANQGSASSSSSLRDRSRSTSSTVGRRMSATSDYPRNPGTARLPRERSAHVATIRELVPFNDHNGFSLCAYCVIL